MTLTREELLQRYMQMRLIDDDLMNVALKNNKPAVQHILRIILDIPDLEVTETVIQDIIQNRSAGHSVKLDVTARDSNNRIYDIEFQRIKSKASPKRARYHCASIDDTALGKSKDFDNLPEVYVIFITEGDYYGKNKAIYHVDRMVRETGELYEDAEHIVYANALYRGDSPLGELMHDLTTSEPKDIKNPVLAEAVSYAKNSEEKDKMYYEDSNIWTDAQIEELKEDIRDEWHEIGIREGKTLGIKEGRTLGLNEGRTLGLNEGMSKGRETANNAWITNLRNAGMSEAQIKALMPASN